MLCVRAASRPSYFVFVLCIYWAPLDAVEEKNAWRDFGQPLRSAREHFERDYLEFHLLQTRGNISELSRRTELERTHLYRKLKGLGLNPKDEKYRQ